MGEGQRNRRLKEKSHPKEAHGKRCQSQEESQTAEENRQTSDGNKHEVTEWSCGLKG